MTTSPQSVQPDFCVDCPLKYQKLCQAVLGLAERSRQKNSPRLRSIQSEVRLHEENERPDFAGILRKGYLRMERILQDGRRSVLGFLAPGDMIGDALGLVHGPALISASDAEYCFFDPASLRRALKEDAWLYAQLLEEVMKQHTRQLDMVWRRGALGSRERIIAFMVMAAEFMPTEPLPDGSVILSMQVTRKDWADFSNTAVETICRTLAQLAEKGEVEAVGPARYRIRDLRALAALAGLDLQSDLSSTFIGELSDIRAPAKGESQKTLNAKQPIARTNLASFAAE